MKALRNNPTCHQQPEAVPDALPDEVLEGAGGETLPVFSATVVPREALLVGPGAFATTNIPRTKKTRITIRMMFQRRNFATAPGAGGAKLHLGGP